MRRFWLVFVFLVSCQQTPCQESTAERSALSSLRWVPASASAVVQTVRLQSALELSAQLVDRMPPTSKFVLARQQWQRVLGVDPLKAEDWTGLGVDVAGSATVFEDGGHWIVHARVVAPETLTAWIEARRLANTFIVETQDINGWTVTHLSLQDKTSVLAIAVLGGDTLFLPAARLQPGT